MKNREGINIAATCCGSSSTKVQDTGTGSGRHWNFTSLLKRNTSLLGEHAEVGLLLLVRSHLGRMLGVGYLKDAYDLPAAVL